MFVQPRQASETGMCFTSHSYWQTSLSACMFANLDKTIVLLSIELNYQSRVAGAKHMEFIYLLKPHEGDCTRPGL